MNTKETKMRELKPELLKYIDDKLAGNAIAQNAILDKDPRTLMVEAAKACVGIREATNQNDGYYVELIQKTSGGRKGDAWCAFFVMSIIAYAELKTGLKSKVKHSGSCASIWNSCTSDMLVKYNPLPGGLCVWRHHNGSGHIGIVVAADEETMFLVEGNTTSGLDPDGKIEREGGGCYFTKRSRCPTGEMKIRGFIKPF